MSFLYLDMVRVVQDGIGVCAQIQVDDYRTDLVYLPTAALSCLLLGPGVSITAPALTTLARYNTRVICVGAGGVRAYAGILPDSLTAHWREQQVAAWAGPERRLEVAVRMYQMRFKDADLPESVTLEQLRGMEGQRMKAFYKILAQQHCIGRFRRNYRPDQWDSQDPVTLALSAANTCLYGIVHAALLALGLSPALGYVHAGTQHAFVYDIADLYKADTTFPSPLPSTTPTAPNNKHAAASGEDLRLLRLLPRIVHDVQSLLTPPHTTTTDEEHSERRDVRMVHLWDPKPEPSPQVSTTPQEKPDALHGRHRHHRRPRPPTRHPQQDGPAK
ncbi:type I-E CRISPR-associated endonuclease Cas1e [Streptomyces werraensis]|uniref:type I-E CRISPR-associated endonuclease Cas1e n=1 Tax=Streptomyces werraensis TaxID=68284 RepID=UPI00226B1AE9